MEIKNTCQHVMDKRTDRQTDGWTSCRGIDCTYSLTLMHLWRTLQGENVCHGAEAPRGIHIIPNMLDITTISITGRYSNINIDIVCLQLFLLGLQNPPKHAVLTLKIWNSTQLVPISVSYITIVSC